MLTLAACHYMSSSSSNKHVADHAIGSPGLDVSDISISAAELSVVRASCTGKLKLAAVAMACWGGVEALVMSQGATQEPQNLQQVDTS